MSIQWIATTPGRQGRQLALCLAISACVAVSGGSLVSLAEAKQMNGTKKADRLTGTNKGDRINGRGGNDRINRRFT